MKLKRFLFSELKNNPRFTWLFIINIILGLVGFAVLDIYKSSLNHTLSLGSKGLLGADFGISARRPLTEGELLLVSKNYDGQVQASKMTELYSMVASSSGRSRLVQIKAIENNYPFYGKMKKRENTASLSENTVWVYPEVLSQLKLSIGDPLKIGETTFKISDVIDEDSASGFTTGMSPRIYISLSSLKKTRLIRPGSVAWHSAVYKIPGMDIQRLDDLRKEVFKQAENNDLKVYTHENTSEQMGRILRYLNDFLGLTSIAALFLASIGGAFLFRSYLQKRTAQIAILLSLGLTRNQAIVFFASQLLLLGLFASLVSISLATFLVSISTNLISSFFPFQLEMQFSISTLLTVVFLGSFGSLLISWPTLQLIKNLKVTQLLQSDQNQLLSAANKSWLGYIPFLIVFWSLSVWQANSFKIGSLFAGLFLVSLLLLSVISFIALKLLSFIKPASNRNLWSLRDLSRLRFSAITSFVSLALGLLLVNMVPQLKSSIEKEISMPAGETQPSLFLFDIQDEQVNDLKASLFKTGVSVAHLSPMIRARIAQVNGEEFDKGDGEQDNFSREEDRESRFRNRGVNLSYRDKMLSSEKIISGRAFSGRYDFETSGRVEMSIEKRYAKRLKLKLGDHVRFEIEGVPIETEIVNVRSVKWTSFQPNFFIQLQPGVLDDAPKTFIATIPPLEFSKKLEVQDAIVEKLPNVSIIDVTRTVERILSLVEQMSWALNLMSILCLIAGFSVLYSIVSHQMLDRISDIGLLKVLGARFSDIRHSFYQQFLLISTAAAVFGAVFSLGISYILSWLVFESSWSPDIQMLLLTAALALMISFVVTFFATRRALQTKPIKLL